MPKWLERAKREIPSGADRATAVTAERNPIAVTAVPQAGESKNLQPSNVSIGRTPDEHSQKFEANAATLAELEAAANRFCGAVGDDANRRAIMLEDCREFPPERWPWLIEYLNAEAAKHEQALLKNDTADDMRHCTEGANFTGGGRCLAAWQGKLAGFVSTRYSPAKPEQLRRCEGYAPGPDDPDQRPGQDRWPGLLPDLEVTNDET